MNEKLVGALAFVEEGRLLEKAVNEKNEKCEKIREFCLRALEDLKETLIDVDKILSTTPELTKDVHQYDDVNDHGACGILIGRSNCSSSPKFGYFKKSKKFCNPHDNVRNSQNALGILRDGWQLSKNPMFTPGSAEDEILRIKSADLSLEKWTEMQARAEITEFVTRTIVNAVNDHAENYAISQKAKLDKCMKACSKTYEKVGTRAASQ